MHRYSFIWVQPLAFLWGILLPFNMTIFLCLFFSGLAMYLFAKEFWGRGGAFLSAVLYLYAPFHIDHIYVLGSCAQSLAFVFFPLLLLAVYKLHHSRSFGHLILLCLSVAGLTLGHSYQMILFLPIALGFAIYLEFIEPSGKAISSLAIKILAVILGFGVSAYFWVPAMLEKKYVHIEKLTQGWFNFHNHFITFYQLFFPHGDT